MVDCQYEWKAQHGENKVKILNFEMDINNESCEQKADFLKLVNFPDIWLQYVNSMFGDTFAVWNHWTRKMISSVRKLLLYRKTKKRFKNIKWKISLK